VLAYDCVRLVGFATAFTDHALFAFIPLVEVAASHRARGIGSELVRRIARAFGPSTASSVLRRGHVGFYARLGYDRIAGMVRQGLDAVGSGREPLGR
jgi:predicted N-acetyltransferase YhbS